MVKYKSVYSDPDTSKRRKSMTVPDQSLSIKTIVERYTRGVPVDIVQRDPQYVDQTEFDLEAFSRLDFAQKKAMADEFREQAEAVASEIKEREAKRRSDAIEKAKAEAVAQAKAALQPPPSGGALA